MSTLPRKKWREAKLVDLVFFQRGFDITQAQQRPGHYPVISSSGVTSHHDEFKANGPGVIIGRKGTLGLIHFTAGNYWPHDTTLWSKDLKGNNPRFVYYFLHTLDFKRFDIGNSNPTLNRNHIHDLPIRIPLRPLQDEIASVLSAYDDLIETNRRRIGLLEEAARLLYQEWFVRFRFPVHERTRIVDGVPESWDGGSLADFYDTSSGGTPSRTNPDYFTGDHLWVKTQELLNGFITDTEEKITDNALKHSAAKLFPERTVLVAMYGATVGQIGVIARTAASNQACCALIPRDERANFIHAFLFFRENKEKLVKLSVGAAQNNINQQIIRSYPMLMPPTGLMTTFRDTLQCPFDQLLNLQRQNQNLKAARDLLLPRLMSGEIG